MSNPKQDNQSVVKAIFITTNDFLIKGDCLGCGTCITRHNSKLKEGVRTCVCCSFQSPTSRTAWK